MEYKGRVIVAQALRQVEGDSFLILFEVEEVLMEIECYLRQIF